MSALAVYSLIYLEQHKQEHMCALAFLPEEAFSSFGGLGWKGGEEIITQPPQVERVGIPGEFPP